jgi:uncharacterized protein
VSLVPTDVLVRGTDALRKSYKQAELNDRDYPGLIEKPESVATLSVGTVLTLYNWPPNSERHRKITRFVQALFRPMDKLRFHRIIPNGRRWI